MAGGTFLSMNKTRPGAYINFESVPKPLSGAGERGIMTMAVPLTWGPEDEIIELSSEDLSNGGSLNKIGFTALDSQAQVFRQALSNAYMAYVYRLDIGGVKATAELGVLKITAKYAGSTGNHIDVAIMKKGLLFDVVTFFDGSEADRQTVSKIEDLKANDWVVFSRAEEDEVDPEEPNDTDSLGENEPNNPEADAEGGLEEFAGISLEGGADGRVEATTYEKYFKALKGYKPWNTMAVVSNDENEIRQAVKFIKDMRENRGRKVQAVVFGYPEADHEGIISVDQGYKTTTEEVKPEVFTAYVAGLTAGAAVNQSNTYKVIPGAVEISNQKDDAEISELLKNGCFLISRRQDGAVIIEQDINTFTSYQTNKGKEFSKNRVIRTIDGYATDIQNLFERYYIGKVNNDDDGKNLFKADVLYYLEELQNMGAIQNFDSNTDIRISAGKELDEVVMDLWIQPVDSMEKLYNKVYLRSNQ